MLVIFGTLTFFLVRSWASPRMGNRGHRDSARPLYHYGSGRVPQSTGPNISNRSGSGLVSHCQVDTRIVTADGGRHCE